MPTAVRKLLSRYRRRSTRGRLPSQQIRCRPRLESLENRHLLATLGIDIRFLTDDQGSPGAEIQGQILRGESFWVDVQVQDIRAGQSQGVIALPLNISWDPSLVQFVGDANLTAQGTNSLPIDDRLVTSQFPLQRAVDSFDDSAGPFDPTADPNSLLSFFNLRGVSGAALPNANQGQAIGAGQSETFSQLQFVAVANDANAPITVNLDGAMSFADADVLDDVTAIGNASQVNALANTVAAAVPIEGVSLSGTKFDDTNGNGNRDAGEPGVEGVTIQLTPADSQQSVVTVTTAAGGAYQFDDLPAGGYTVSEVSSSNTLITFPATNGYDVTLAQGSPSFQDLDFGNFTLVTLSGTKFNDANGNGVRDSGEVGIAGVTIRLDVNDDGDPGNDPAPQVTDASGNYGFTLVGPGTHTITEEVPAGFRQTLPVDGAGYTVITSSGQDQQDLDFGNTSTSTISGFKFDDLDGDGVRDPGEPGRGGITIELDLDNDASVDQTVVTAADGSFRFEQVPAGTHGVSEIVPTGSVRTTPDSVPIVVTVDSANSVSDLLFGNFQLTSLGGVVFNDLDGDGIQDAGEAGFSNVVVRLSDGSQDVTDANGSYQFDNVGPGTFTITADVPANFRPTIPTNSQRTVNNRSGTSLADLNFGNEAIADDNNSISGIVYSDVDRDGVVDATEFGLPGVTVQLFRDGAATPTATTTTVADGSYLFTDLADGSYRVVEIQPSGFIDASITRGTVLPSGEVRGATDGLNAFDGIVLSGEETAIDYNFGEVLASVTKRMFLASTNVRAELSANLGLRSQSVRGTAGDDQIRVEHLADNRLSVTVNNNSPVILSSQNAQIVLVDGLGGQDSVTIVGNSEDESIRATASQVAFTTSSQMLGVFNVPQIRVEGGGGNDTAELREGSGASQLTASGSSAVLDLPGTDQIELIQIDTVRAISAVDSDDDRAIINAIDYVLTLAGDWQ